MAECRKLIVYPDGFYSREEAQVDLRPFAVIEFCDEGIISVKAAGLEAQKVNIGDCLKALRELQEDENGLLEASRLFGPGDGIEKLVDRCGGIDNLMLTVALHIARHKTVTDKSVYEVLTGGDGH